MCTLTLVLTLTPRARSQKRSSPPAPSSSPTRHCPWLEERLLHGGSTYQSRCRICIKTDPIFPHHGGSCHLLELQGPGPLFVRGPHPWTRKAVGIYLGHKDQDFQIPGVQCHIGHITGENLTPSFRGSGTIHFGLYAIRMDLIIRPLLGDH